MAFFLVMALVWHHGQQCRPIQLALPGSPIRSHGQALEPAARSVSELPQNANSERQLWTFAKNYSLHLKPVISVVSDVRSIETGHGFCT